MDINSTVIIIPGLGNSGPQHWQTHWQQQFGFSRVEQNDWETPVCADWTGKINEEVCKGGTPDVLLVAHSLGCAAVAYWVQQFGLPIKGALLVSPADTEAESLPPGTSGFAPITPKRLFDVFIFCRLFKL